MAELVMAAATPHNPLLWRSMRDPVPDDLRDVSANFGRIRDAIREQRVDTLVVVGSDHIRQFFWDNAPAFTVGVADSFHGTFENEVRTFGTPYREVTGCSDLAREIVGRETLPESFDFAVSHEWRLDHSFVVPLIYLRPDFDLPVVPVNTNCVMPPLPAPVRFVELGRHIRASVERWDGPGRVGLLTSSHMANEIGGVRQFLGGGSADADFDAMAVDSVRSGDIDRALGQCTYDRLATAGNMTYQFVNVLTAMAAMDGVSPELAEATASRFSPSAFFLWRAS